ncbi:hypothetical protein J7376_16785 [Paracoccus sp. R12_1]|uniref:GFA family protein n=1 Tax=unclassified Paracoccus (in: a-proteobacteria) TaxID=2688777 RepID=UPI001AD99168|nr:MULTISPECIES: hypothetical protein [unclassified Paracoccus (in: a-proteobacteria)]MBO9456566.1 hypothetical protein [Paracoccus sp. R12_2]MBO9488172.1 hypothetical protein [Paracoccus sp. R12_1]
MTTVTCSCGAAALDLDGPPILAAECHCTSCRAAAERFAAPVTEPNSGTRFVLQRKDKAKVVKGEAHLASFRLSDDASTQRIVATCCNAPMWLEFKGGHWISVYAARWPQGEAPRPELRTMTKDASGTLSDDLPNAKTQSAGFMGRLFWAWVQMGFRNPPVADVRRTLND